MKYNILIGGAAGQGIDTLSLMLEKILKSQGYYIFSNKDYMSRVRGGHNFIQIRFGTEPVYSHWPKLDAIIALDKSTIDFHKERLGENGIIICDESIKSDTQKTTTIPMNRIASELKNPRSSGLVAAGAVLKLFGIPVEAAEEVVEDKFSGEFLISNLNAIKKGYNLTDIKFSLDAPKPELRLLINGNQAIALGALAGGVGLYASYPMTPATSIMTYLSHKQKDSGIIVEQAEDEISALNMVLGSSYAGLRSMTGTSGGGLALMVEGLSLQGIMEIPIVVVNAQRPGPATGLPTRTGQEDLQFVLNAGHGEFPRMILAVKNPRDAFYQTVRALNLADKYNLMVIILTDQFVADSSQTIPPYDFDSVCVNRYFSKDDDFKSYKINDSGVSPRITPGEKENIVSLADSHEHDEYGHITEDATIRDNMMVKRMKKLEHLSRELLEPDYFGVDNPKTLLIGWGSMYGPLKEAVELLREEGLSIGCLVFGDVYPLPTKLLTKYSCIAENLVNVEQNFTGQLGKLIRQETGISMTHSLLKYNGRQLSSWEIYLRVKEEVL